MFKRIKAICRSLISSIKVKKIIISGFINSGKNISLTNHFCCQKVEHEGRYHI